MRILRIRHPDYFAADGRSLWLISGVRAAVLADVGLTIASEWMFSPELRSGAVRASLWPFTSEYGSYARYQARSIKLTTIRVGRSIAKRA